MFKKIAYSNEAKKYRVQNVGKTHQSAVMVSNISRNGISNVVGVYDEQINSSKSKGK